MVSPVDTQALAAIATAQSRIAPRSITWHSAAQSGGNAYDPDSGRATTVWTDVAGVLPLVFGEPTVQQITAGLAQVGGAVLLLRAEGLGFTPKLEDQVTVDGTRYAIGQIVRVAPIEATLLWRCFLFQLA